MLEKTFILNDSLINHQNQEQNLTNRKVLNQKSLKLPGVKMVARNCKTVWDCWKIFFPVKTIEEIVKFINEQLKIFRALYSPRKRDYQPINHDEITASFGVLYNYIHKKGKPFKLLFHIIWFDCKISKQEKKQTMWHFLEIYLTNLLNNALKVISGGEYHT